MKRNLRELHLIKSKILKVIYSSFLVDNYLKTNDI